MNKRYLYKIIENTSRKEMKKIYQFERDYPESYHAGETIQFQEQFKEYPETLPKTIEEMNQFEERFKKYYVIYTITGIHHSPVEKIITLNVEKRR